MMQCGAKRHTGMKRSEDERQVGRVSLSSTAGHSEEEAPVLLAHNYRDYSRIPPPPGESPYPENIDAMSFAQKVHHMLFNTTEFTCQAIRWCRHGRAFRVVDPLLLEATMELLPKHFGHDDYTKFFSDLSRAGFHRISNGPDMGCFWNEFFLQGLPHLCKCIPDEAPQDNRPSSDPDFQDIAAKYPLPGVDAMDDETKASSANSNSTGDSQRTSTEDALLLLSHPSLRQLLSPESRDALTRNFTQDQKLPVHPSLGGMSREEISQLFAPLLAVSPSLRRALGFATDDDYETIDEKIDSGANMQPGPLNFYPGFQSWFGEAQGGRLRGGHGLDAPRTTTAVAQQQQPHSTINNNINPNMEAAALLPYLQQQQQSLLSHHIAQAPQAPWMLPGQLQQPIRSVEEQLREIQVAIALSQNQQQQQQQQTIVPDHSLLSLLERQSTGALPAQQQHQQLLAPQPQQLSDGDQILALRMLMQLQQQQAANNPPNYPR